MNLPRSCSGDPLPEFIRDLPGGWEEWLDVEGENGDDHYFFHRGTGQLQWERPSEPSTPAQQLVSQPPSQLPKTSQPLRASPSLEASATPEVRASTTAARLDVVVGVVVAGHDAVRAVGSRSTGAASTDDHEGDFSATFICDLPGGWEEWVDVQGGDGDDHYYFHRETGTTQWERPEEALSQAAAPTSPESRASSLFGSIEAVRCIAAPSPSAPVVGSWHAGCCDVGSHAAATRTTNKRVDGNEVTIGQPVEDNPWANLCSGNGTEAINQQTTTGGDSVNLWAKFKGLSPGNEAHRLIDEAVDGILPLGSRARLQGPVNGLYLDGTFGLGDTSREILRRVGPGSRLVAFDIDASAEGVGRTLEAEDSRFRFVLGTHADFGLLYEDCGFGKLGACSDIVNGFEGVSGAVVDLSIVSPPLTSSWKDQKKCDGTPLDLRRHQTTGMPAYQWLQSVSGEELAGVLWHYGLDDAFLCERIAEAVVGNYCFKGASMTWRGLRDIVWSVSGAYDSGVDMAKLAFGAIRTHINKEMQQVSMALRGCLLALSFGGLCSVICHGNNERAVLRQFVRQHQEPSVEEYSQLTESRACELFPILHTDCPFTVQQIGAPIRPAGADSVSSRFPRSAVFVLRKESRRYPILASARPRSSEERMWEPRVKPVFSGTPVAP